MTSSLRAKGDESMLAAMKATRLLLVLITSCGPAESGNGPGPSPSDGAVQPDGAGGDGGGGGGDDGGGPDPDPDPAPPYKSGSRIKMHMLTTPDGAKIFQGNFDAMRNEPCSFRIAADGVTRCLPTAAVYGAYHADSACTVPALTIIPSCSTAPKYLYRYTDGCYSKFQVFSVNPIPLSGSLFGLSGTTCTQIPVPSGQVAYGAAGPEIPPTSFQSATLAVE